MKSSLLIGSLFLGACLMGIAQGTIITVPGSQPTIQAGIDAASFANSDTILVSHGTYYENINFKGKRITVASLFIIDRDPQHINATSINGSLPTHPDTASVVLMVNGEDSMTVLEGFTLTGGTGTVWTDPHGAGVYREGGAVLSEFGSPVICYNIIINNEAILRRPGVLSAGGGGIRAGDGNPHILNNIIMHNRGRYGAGIVLNYAWGVIKNNVIAYNTGGEDYSGSGIWKYNGGGDALIENNTIVGNQSALAGGGVYISATSMTLHNNIIWNNTAPSLPQINIRSGASAVVTYCDIQGGWSGATNINVDPQFRGNHLYLPASSPCIDAGDPAPAFNDPEKPAASGFAHWPAMGNLHNDMGAYGGHGSYPFEWIAIFGDPLFGWVPFDVNFMAESWLDVTSWAWTFGDGGSAGTQSPTHTYLLPAIYDVSISVDTGAGLYIANAPGLITAIADSLIAGEGQGSTGSSIGISIYGRNTVPLDKIMVPVSYIGELNLRYDSFSTAGCRTDYFENKSQPALDSIGKNLAIELVSSSSGTSPALTPGVGPVLKVYFTIRSTGSTGVQSPINLSGWGSYLPIFHNNILNYAPKTLSGMVTQTAVCGDPNGDKKVNVADAVYLINYIFKSGPTPNPLCSGDPNHDSKVNVADAVYMINHIFKSGPAPLTPCCQ